MNRPPSPRPRTTALLKAAIGFSALGGLLFGYDTGVISGAILFIKDAFHLTSGAEEGVVSAVLLGAILGAGGGGRLADKWGRKPVIVSTAALFVAGSILTALSPSVAWIVAGRIVVGVAIGAASLAAPLYISEVAPVHLRGSMVSLNQLALTSGIVVSYLVDYALSSHAAWGWMMGLAAVPAAVLAVGMAFMPETPRWLISYGKTDRGQTTLARLRGDVDTAAEVRDITQNAGRQSGHWRDLMAASLRPALVVGVGLAFLQQVTGINTVIYYAPTIFQMAGFSSGSKSILITAGVGVVNVVMTIVALLLIDRAGRRPLLLVGLAGMAASLFGLGAAFLAQGSRALGLVAVASLVIYVASFAIGLGPVFWLLISEIYPQKVRGLAMSAASLVNWAANGVVALTFLTLIDGLGKTGTFWLYGAITVGAWFFSYRKVPETKGKTLEEIERHWRSGQPPHTLGSAPPITPQNERLAG